MTGFAIFCTALHRYLHIAHFCNNLIGFDWWPINRFSIKAIKTHRHCAEKWVLFPDVASFNDLWCLHISVVSTTFSVLITASKKLKKGCWKWWSAIHSSHLCAILVVLPSIMIALYRIRNIGWSIVQVGSVSVSTFLHSSNNSAEKVKRHKLRSWLALFQP